MPKSNQPVKYEVWFHSGGRYHKLYSYSRDSAYFTRLDNIATYSANENVLVRKVEQDEWYTASFNRDGYRWRLDWITPETVRKLVLVGINSPITAIKRHYTKNKQGK